MKALNLKYDRDRVKVWPSAAGGRIGVQVSHRPRAAGAQPATAATFISRRNATVLRDWLTAWLKETNAGA